MSASLQPADVVWIISDTGDLGVQIGDKCFFYVDGISKFYVPIHLDGTPRLYRTVEADFDFPRTHYPTGTIRAPLAQYRQLKNDNTGTGQYTSGSGWKQLPAPMLR